MNKIPQNIFKACPVTFEEGGHTYTLNSTGKLVPGVTTICDNLNKPFLKAWAAKEAVKDLGYFDPKQTPKEKWDEMMARGEAIKQELAKMDTKEYMRRLEFAKGACNRKSKEALDSGSLAHEWIERKIAGQKPKLAELKDKKAKSAVKAFLAWEKTHRVEWLASEIVVGSEKHEYGGKFDAIASLDGIPTLIDWKTSNQISKDYFIQTAGYQIALEEMGLQIWQRMIVRIPKDGSGFEALIVPTPLDLDKKTFLALRQVQRFTSYVASQDNDVVDSVGKIKVTIETNA